MQLSKSFQLNVVTLGYVICKLKYFTVVCNIVGPLRNEAKLQKFPDIA